MNAELKKQIMERIEKEYDENSIVTISVNVNKFANKCDLIVETRVRLTDERTPYNHG